MTRPRAFFPVRPFDLPPPGLVEEAKRFFETWKEAYGAAPCLPGPLSAPAVTANHLSSSAGAPGEWPVRAT